MIGEGEYGLVKLASHNESGKKVAIKQIKKQKLKDIEVFQQRREIEVLKMSQHPNIISLVDLFEDSNYHFIVLEYMAGNDLFEYMKTRNYKLGEKRVCEIAYQIALGL